MSASEQNFLTRKEARTYAADVINPPVTDPQRRPECGFTPAAPVEVPIDLITAARMEVATADVQRVAKSGWKIRRYDGFRGVNFVGQRGCLRIRGEKNHSEQIAFQRLLNLLMRYDEEAGA